jgi:hypothetical protein
VGNAPANSQATGTVSEAFQAYHDICHHACCLGATGV